jgi:thiol-disulfide isomerase/thioredoxin
VRPYLIAIAACLTSAACTRADDILNLGDPAPPMAVSSWIKGDKVESFESGKTYVVEFWATWCGPCRATIPHLTELAHKYKGKGVRFVGVDVWERDTSLVKPYLEEMGDKMDYSVALDRVPEKGDANEGAMALTWMKAAEENGIPSAFIVHDGKIAWIGHPMAMDEPLEKVTAGDWDPRAKAAGRLAEKAKERKMMAVRQKVYKPFRDGDYKGVLAAIEEATASDPELTGEFDMIRFAALGKGGDIDAALALGTKLIDTYKDNAGGLNGVAWYVIDPDLKPEPDPRLAQLALKVARRADELSKGENIAVLDTLAMALYRTGDPAEAVATEERALKRLEAEAKDRSHPYFKMFEERLTLFRKAAEEKSDRP